MLCSCDLNCSFLCGYVINPIYFSVHLFLFEFNFRFFSIVALILFFEYVNICRVQKSKLYKKADSDLLHSNPYLLVLPVFLFAGSKYIHILISFFILHSFLPPLPPYSQILLAQAYPRACEYGNLRRIEDLTTWPG